MQYGHLLFGGGMLAWPVALAAWIWLLRLRGPAEGDSIDPVVHLATLWLIVVLVSIELDLAGPQRAHRRAFLAPRDVGAAGGRGAVPVVCPPA